MKIVEERLPYGDSTWGFTPPKVCEDHMPPPALPRVRRSRAVVQSPPGSPCARTASASPSSPPWEPTREDREAAVTMACFGCTEIIYELCNDCRTDPELHQLFQDHEAELKFGPACKTCRSYDPDQPFCLQGADCPGRSMEGSRLNPITLDEEFEEHQSMMGNV